MRSYVTTSINNGSRRPGVAILAVLLTMLFAPTTWAQTRIRLGTLVPSGSSYYHSLKSMGAKWKQASNGAITLTLYGGGTMGSEDEIVRRMRIGQLQARC